MIKVSVLCGTLHFIRLMDRYIELRAVQIALNYRIELLFVDLYQFMDRIGKCVQKAASLSTIDTACRCGFNLRHADPGYRNRISIHLALRRSAKSCAQPLRPLNPPLPLFLDAQSRTRAPPSTLQFARHGFSLFNQCSLLGSL
jgi:hypothetical protein